MKRIIALTILIASMMQLPAQGQGDPILNSIIKIASPIETADLIRANNLPYQPGLLNNANTTYVSPEANALNLGIYSTNLGYANIYGQSEDSQRYLSAVGRTARAIRFADGHDLSRHINIFDLAANRDNLNKLLEITSETFEKMSEDLQANGKSDLAVLILAGAFIETAHIISQEANRHPDKQELKNKLIEQKFVLSQILPVLNNYAANPQVAQLSMSFQELQDEMDKYDFQTENTTNGGTEVVKSIGGVEVISFEGQSQSRDINLSGAELQKIAGIVSQIRAKIVK
ncbi:MAG: hypothetical protein OHK0053_10220 [Microscillaceae bacterium]